MINSKRTTQAVVAIVHSIQIPLHVAQADPQQGKGG